MGFTNIFDTTLVPTNVNITAGTVAVSAVSGTVSIAGSVTITSGSVSVSSVAGTVSIAGAVTITSGSVAVSAVSGTVTVAGSVSISSGTVAVSAVSGTVTVSGAVTITSGTVAISSISGTVTVSTSGNVSVVNGSGTSLLTTPTLTKQYQQSVTFTNAATNQTISVNLNATDRVLAIFFKCTAGTNSGGSSSFYGSISANVTGGSTLAQYTDYYDLPSTEVPLFTTGGLIGASPLCCPAYGVVDSTVSIALYIANPYTTFSVTYQVTVLTAPDPGMVGSTNSPVYVAGTPQRPVTVVPMGGSSKYAAGTSGSTITIPAGYVWRIHSMAGYWGTAGNMYVVDGASTLAALHFNYAAGRNTFFCEGLEFSGSITPTWSTALSGSSVVISYDAILAPQVV
jgi:hypothetical protein